VVCKGRDGVVLDRHRAIVSRDGLIGLVLVGDVISGLFLRRQSVQIERFVERRRIREKQVQTEAVSEIGVLHKSVYA